eukprot:5132688-Lingulodinium_polyedra.AAC.1
MSGRSRPPAPRRRLLGEAQLPSRPAEAQRHGPRRQAARPRPRQRRPLCMPRAGRPPRAWSSTAAGGRARCGSA